MFSFKSGTDILQEIKMKQKLNHFLSVFFQEAIL